MVSPPAFHPAEDLAPQLYIMEPCSAPHHCLETPAPGRLLIGCIGKKKKKKNLSLPKSRPEMHNCMCNHSCLITALEGRGAAGGGGAWSGADSFWLTFLPLFCGCALRVTDLRSVRQCSYTQECVEGIVVGPGVLDQQLSSRSLSLSSDDRNRYGDGGCHSLIKPTCQSRPVRPVFIHGVCADHSSCSTVRWMSSAE